MSILPMGDTTADQPGREYQARLNKERKLPPANPELEKTGLFKKFWGPAGACPVQLKGILPNGEFVYFRARGNKVELQIFSVQGTEQAHYLKQLETDHELGTGVLPEEICVSYIKRWMADYTQRLSDPQAPYSGAPFEVTEPVERIAI